MKNKIIEAIRNKYKDLGLGDKAIEGAAVFLEPSIKEESEIETAVAGVAPLLKAFQSDTDVIRTAKTTAEKRITELEAQVKANGGAPVPKAEPNKGDDDFDAKMQKWYKENVEPLKTELDGYKAKETASARAALIATKAKEAGIPEWRIKQGFNIADDADEPTIVATMATIQQDIVTAGLPNKTGFPLSTTADQAKERAMKWAEGLPDKSNEKK